MNDCPGLYVGEVIDDFDRDENRYRVKVRVYGINSDVAPPDGLPWAEVTYPGASPVMGGAGDFKPYRNGDRVYVMFIAGNSDLPVVIGPMTNIRAGVPSTPIGQSVDHETGKKRWTRRDREGNTIELSENAKELHVKLQSGGAAVTLSQHGDSISIKSQGGRVRVEGATVEVAATTASVTGRSVTINADGVDITEQDNGHVDMHANKRVDITTGALGALPSVGGLIDGDEVNIGGSVDHFRGKAVTYPAGRKPLQSARTNLRADYINVGVGLGTDKTVDYDGVVKLPSTTAVTIRASAKITIKTAGIVDIQSAAMVNVSTTNMFLSATVTATLQSLGPLNVLSAGPLTLSSVSSLSLVAPNINFSMEGAVPPVVVPPIP